MENPPPINNREEAINSWENFRKTQIWQAIIRDLQIDVDKAEKAINKIGDNDVKYSDKDLMIIKKEILNKVINYPQKMIEYHQGIFEEPVEDYDPFNEKLHYDEI
jgi:hypothetical protein